MVKVIKVNVGDNKYVYLISIEDIIHERLKAAVHWKSESDREWGFKLLVGNVDRVDLAIYRKVGNSDSRDRIRSLVRHGEYLKMKGSLIWLRNWLS